MPGRLDGEIALVTGSTSGLGRTVALLFASEGATVVVTGRDEARGEAIVASITDAGGRAAFVAGDLADPSTPERLVAASTDAFGALTVLVNNAVAVGRDAPLLDTDPSEFAAAMYTNAVAPAMLCRAAIPRMLDAGRGSIVNVSSRAAVRASPGLSAYVTAKSALEGLARTITIDYAARGIRANNVRPGYILHDARDTSISSEQLAARQAQHLTRIPNATDVAWAIVYLASRESEVVSGITITVDGGSSAVRGRTLG